MAFALVAEQSCSSGSDTTTSLLKKDSPKVCSASEVKASILDTLKAKAGTMSGSLGSDPRVTQDIIDTAIGALAIKFDLITLDSADPSVHKLSCSSDITISTGTPVNGANGTYKLSYSIQPSVDDPSLIITSSNINGASDTLAQVLLDYVKDAVSRRSTNPLTSLPSETEVDKPVSPPASMISYTSYDPLDCSKGQLGSLGMICNDTKLSQYDKAVSTLYNALPRSTSADELRKSQAEWIASRAKCVDEKCLLDLYISRIGELMAESEAASSYERSDKTSTLRIFPVDDTNYAFYFDAFWAGPGSAENGNVNIGQLSGTVRLVDGAGLFKDDDCTINFQKSSAGKWKVTNVEPASCSMGLNVSYNGVYAKASAK